MFKKYSTDGQSTDNNITRPMRFACWITKVTNTHSEYVIVIAYLLQKWSRERKSVLQCNTNVTLLNKQSCPWTGLDRSWELQKVEVPRIPSQTIHEGGKFVNPTHRPPLPPRIYPLYTFLSEA